MNAPTPASSLIHSSTLVIMGIYILIRFNLILEFTPCLLIIMALIGSITICIGAVIAIFQTDIKKMVAYSTISQMGYLMAGCGFSAYDETIVYLIMHAINKAFLFIIVGYTVHFFNSNTDLRQMGGLFIISKNLSYYFLVICFNLMGLPFSSGFYSKEFLLFQTININLISILIKSL
jgi:NADH:ubiquinone oxidoreductase subunit 5 (subunit L)/multisubunit Na+/H+ antiporter MnhA subunit